MTPLNSKTGAPITGHGNPPRLVKDKLWACDEVVPDEAQAVVQANHFHPDLVKQARAWLAEGRTVAVVGEAADKIIAAL